MARRLLLALGLLFGSSLTAQDIRILRKVDHGRLEDHSGLRLLRLWGNPTQRGTAHGQLLGKEMAALLRSELTARFGEHKELLTKARWLLPLFVRYPKVVREELRALYRAARQAEGVDLRLPAFKRNLDYLDVLLINAMDIVALMGCSGFTIAGDNVAGGGVLTARNFDWPLTGDFLIRNCMLIVQHPTAGKACATVGWAGYIGAVTGVNEAGIATFLHVGNSGGKLPKASLPTAIAAREILRRGDAENAFEVAAELIAKTSPPAGYLTRVVNSGAPPAARAGGGAVRVFEADIAAMTLRKVAPISVVTNHFLSRQDDAERWVPGDSATRMKSIRTCLETDLQTADKKVSVAEAWRALQRVERHGSFATLHSLVFRHQPWVFELRIGEPRPDGGARGAPGGKRRYRLSRNAVFAR